MTDAASELVASCLAAVERALDRRRPGWADDAELAATATRLSEGFTADDAHETPALDAQHEAAYLAYFAPRTIAAVAEAVAGAPPPSPTCDLGAGTGAASLVLAAAGARELTLWDRDPRALDAARALIADVAPDARVSVRATDLKSGDVVTSAPSVVSAFAVSELAREPDDAWARLRTLVGDAERVLLIDAGDRRRARLVQEVRALALAEGWHVRAPCPHEDECPALARRRDWCHARAPRRLPASFARFAEAVGRDPGFVAFSYLDLVRAPHPHDAAGARVIGEPLVEKGRARLGICGASGLRFVQALKRHKPALRALRTVERGALLDASRLEVRGQTAHLEAPEDLVIVDEGTS